ncbi:MAG TPA: ABC transporter substrate-binding protein, partial [Oscillospiraceae bacterium]|nr:ABC transporter substrate-binding protein [Oscillospiraceae bacterium]
TKTETPASESPASETPVQEDKMFNVVLTAPFTGFDPLRTNDSASTYVNAQIYETLYRIAADGSYTPLLAESLPEYSEDGLSATVKLRQGVKFQDGTDFNAEAVKYTFDLIMDPDFGSARASLAASIDSMDILDDYTIRFNLKYEDGVLTAKLAHTNSAIVSPTAQANQDLMVDPCGTGPYKFVSSVSGSDVVLTRNDDYWGDAPTIKDVTMTIITDESTALARLETGEADFMPVLSVESISRVESMSNVTFATSDAAQIYYVALRPNSYINPLMANLDFRTAIVKALDREGYVDYVMENYATYAKSIIGPSVFGYDESIESHNIGYDLEGAKKLIEDNGWQDEVIKFLVPSTPAYTPMGEYFQANLKAAGFNNVEIEAIDWSAWLTESKTDNRFDITLAAWSNVTRDGTELLEPNWHSVNSSKRTRVDSPVLDQLIEEGKMTADDTVRLEKLAEANNFLMDNADVAPVYNNINRFAFNSAYANVTLDAGGTFYLKDFTFAQ